MSPWTRKLLLTLHVVTSVGWLGAVAAFLVLSVVGKTGAEPNVVRGAYLSMNALGELVIVPFSILSLSTGLIQSLKTPWGLFRHYWVAVKFILTLLATALLLLHQFTAVAGAAAIAASASTESLAELSSVGTQLLVDAGLGLVVLLINTTLSIFKPWGKTSYGKRAEKAVVPSSAKPEMPLGLKVLVGAFGMFFLGVVVAHLTGHGLHHHGM